MIAAIGAVLILCGILAFLVQIVVSIRNREALADLTGDPWNGRTLEWATSSPPPAYNFAFTPVVHSIDAWWDMKQNGYVRPTSGFIPIHMPRNTGAGVVLAGISVAVAFGLIWHIWWLAAGGFVTLVAVAIAHSFNRDRDFHVPVREVARVEAERTALLEQRA
ncbi:cytochrome bo(3) ubiquinol oxidase subunit 1 [mine drainage metagenome]|uniref:Cytochrome bo(3) ubiquinol oxidase subunit 1 n=1 Tax=mine drainage metagenome TaxID=410659 RepID=A0A1J5P6E2_9ZZZZ